MKKSTMKQSNEQGSQRFVVEKIDDYTLFQQKRGHKFEYLVYHKQQLLNSILSPLDYLNKDLKDELTFSNVDRFFSSCITDHILEQLEQTKGTEEPNTEERWTYDQTLLDSGTLFDFSF